MTTDSVGVLVDRIAIEDAIYRYASCIDVRDMDGVRAVLSDDLWAQYGNSDPITGGDTVVKWIDESTRDCIWQHHLLNVYHVDLDGDRAKVLVYHTSRQVFASDPDTVNVLVARYHNEVVRTADGWKISRLVMEILWGERGQDTNGYLELVGGRGPKV
jgi:SnoaL-like domain